MDLHTLSIDVVLSLDGHRSAVLLIQQFIRDFVSGEQSIDVFHFKALGLGEEDVDYWYPETVEDGEDYVGTPPDISNSWGSNLND